MNATLLDFAELGITIERPAYWVEARCSRGHRAAAQKGADDSSRAESAIEQLSVENPNCPVCSAIPMKLLMEKLFWMSPR